MNSRAPHLRPSSPDCASTVRRTPRVFFCLLAAATLLVASGATADSSTSAEVLVILAKEEGPTDPELQKIEALQKLPFSSFKSKKVLEKHAVKISTDKPADVTLPNGRKLQLSLVERLPDGRAKIQVSITKENKKDYLPHLQVIASPREPFFIAGQKFEGGTLIIGVQIDVKAPAKAPANTK